MAINEILKNIDPMIHTEIACTQDSPNISIPTSPPSIDFCYCTFECEYNEKVFASPGNEDYKNDKSSLIYELVDSGGTIEIKLFKNGVHITTIVDNTLGTYTPVGGFTSTSLTDHSLKSGFICEWELVYNTYGVGQYHFETVVTNFTRDITNTTQKYNLAVFTVSRADKSTVLKSVQNGYIQGGLDYTGLNWQYQFRIPGKLLYTSPDFEKTTYLNSAREEQQIQAQIIRNFELSCDFIPSILSDGIIDDYILGNELLITDFNIWNASKLTYIEKSLVPTGIEETEYYDRSQNGNFIFSFQERKQNKLKRNYK
jgi:hypothetical protein